MAVGLSNEGILITEVQLPQLTPTEGQWKIEWFGNVDYPVTTQRRRQPSLKVMISLLGSKIQQQAWLPIGSLPTDDSNDKSDSQHYSERGNSKGTIFGEVTDPK